MLPVVATIILLVPFTFGHTLYKRDSESVFWMDVYTDTQCASEAVQELVFPTSQGTLPFDTNCANVPNVTTCADVGNYNFKDPNDAACKLLAYSAPDCAQNTTVGFLGAGPTYTFAGSGNASSFRIHCEQAGASMARKCFVHILGESGADDGLQNEGFDKR